MSLSGYSPAQLPNPLNLEVCGAFVSFTLASHRVPGRGVLHLGVLFETLRREGFEFAIGAPKAVMMDDPDVPGQKLEPVEECTIILAEEYAGTVIQKLTMRKGHMLSYEEAEPGFVKIVMEVPARGLIGYMAGEFKNDVHGQGYILFSSSHHIKC
jgi:predicted membrane GTPase involved in stress response